MNTIEQFQAYLLNRDKSPKTIQGYGADLKQFQKWVGRSLESITPADVRGYRDQLISIGASANTISRHLASLASFGQWGETKGGLFAENPALHVEPVEVAVLAPRWLTKSQKRKLLNVVAEDLRSAREKYPRLWVIRQRDAVMVNFLLATGLRVSELCALRLSDLVLSERKGTVLVRSGKGRKQRSVALMNEIRKELTEWIIIRPQVTSDRIFIGQRGEPVQPRVVQRVVERYTRQAGLDDVTPHTCRHAFAKEFMLSCPYKRRSCYSFNYNHGLWL